MLHPNWIDFDYLLGVGVRNANSISYTLVDPNLICLHHHGFIYVITDSYHSGMNCELLL